MLLAWPPRLDPDAELGVMAGSVSRQEKAANEALPSKQIVVSYTMADWERLKAGVEVKSDCIACYWHYLRTLVCYSPVRQGGRLARARIATKHVLLPRNTHHAMTPPSIPSRSQECVMPHREEEHDAATPPVTHNPRAATGRRGGRVGDDAGAGAGTSAGAGPSGLRSQYDDSGAGPSGVNGGAGPSGVGGQEGVRGHQQVS